MADEETCASPSDQLLASATDPNPEVPPTVLVVGEEFPTTKEEKKPGKMKKGLRPRRKEGKIHIHVKERNE